ncbi:MAG: MFS family permease [Candidatus Paceibacteria bacterium]|jgi:MFS family permease|tara:strand:+ start:13629 stop:14864 length:1236 start_codon:yes stop_codon:yes gene_type:complete
MITLLTQPLTYGLKNNSPQLFQWLLQVFFVGLMLGTTRIVITPLAEQEFGLAKDSLLLLSTFVIAFGVVKGCMNFVAGYWAEKIGRKPVHLAGWLIALPIPVLFYFAQSWAWVVFATVLLGINQGLTWSMSQTAKLDITAADERGLTIGLNEFAGYTGVALGGLASAYISQWLGLKTGLLVFGFLIISLAFILTWLNIVETRPWALYQTQHEAPTTATQTVSTWSVFKRMSWSDSRLLAITQAGCVEKFVDALVWIVYPIYLYQKTQDLPLTGWIISIYGLVWGASQLLTGHWSDKYGRQRLNVTGMALTTIGVLVMPLNETVLWWSFSSALTGLGMALLYPNLAAAIADFSQPQWRATAIGIYRFWRDLGYAIGALLLGLAAYLTQDLTVAFWVVGGCMAMSTAWLAAKG